MTDREKAKEFIVQSVKDDVDIAKVADAIQALEQQPNRCDSCTHSREQDGSNCYECIKGMADNFEAQPTDADCISRDAVIKHICESKECYKDECKGRLYKRCYDLQWIYDLPSVTPQPKVGKWIRRPDRASDIEYRCSECGKIQFADDTNELNYCCNCGSKMEVSE